MFHHRKNSKDSTTSPLSPTASHSSSSYKTVEPYRIQAIMTLSELEQILEDHHHNHVVVFCLPSTHKEPSTHKDDEFDEEAWYGHYERLNNMHFVKVEIDKSEELEERLRPRTKPCWITFHKGSETGGSSGGLKRFVQVHSERRNSS
jgi:hypothetical protein